METEFIPRYTFLPEVQPTLDPGVSSAVARRDRRFVAIGALLVAGFSFVSAGCAAVTAGLVLVMVAVG
jgi:hypothetical protein